MLIYRVGQEASLPYHNGTWQLSKLLARQCLSRKLAWAKMSWLNNSGSYRGDVGNRHTPCLFSIYSKEKFLRSNQGAGPSSAGLAASAGA